MYDPKQNFESPTRLSLIQVTDLSMRQTPLAYFRILNKTKCVPINIIMTVKKKNRSKYVVIIDHQLLTPVSSFVILVPWKDHFFIAFTLVSIHKFASKYLRQSRWKEKQHQSFTGKVHSSSPPRRQFASKEAPLQKAQTSVAKVTSV